jgi:hypothetical protein
VSDRGLLEAAGRTTADFARFVSLWFGFGLATNGLGAVFDAALVNEPFGWGQWAGGLVAVVAAFVVYSRYPEVGSGTVWKFGAVTFLAFVAVGTLAGTMDARTSGSAYHVLKALLVWVGAVAVGWGLTTDTLN